MLTDNVQITGLAFHWVSIHLAHVKTSIRFSYVFNFELPCFMLRMQYADAMIFCNHMILDG